MWKAIKSVMPNKAKNIEFKKVIFQNTILKNDQEIADAFNNYCVQSIAYN